MAFGTLNDLSFFHKNSHERQRDRGGEGKNESQTTAESKTNTEPG